MNNEVTAMTESAKNEKTKVKSAKIIKCKHILPDEQPYFAIEYVNLDNERMLGYGSYDRNQLVNWLNTYFEIIGEDVVKEPSHYKYGQFECIDEMLIVFGAKKTYDFCILNAWKYRNRAPYKGKMDEDLRKADEYLRLAKQIMDCNFEISEIARLIKVGE